MLNESNARRDVLKKVVQSALSLDALGKGLLGGLTGMSALTSQAAPAAWPSKQIHFIVPFSAGGANDLIGRAGGEGAGGRAVASASSGQGQQWPLPGAEREAQCRSLTVPPPIHQEREQ